MTTKIFLGHIVCEYLTKCQQKDKGRNLIFSNSNFSKMLYMINLTICQGLVFECYLYKRKM